MDHGVSLGARLPLSAGKNEVLSVSTAAHASSSLVEEEPGGGLIP